MKGRSPNKAEKEFTGEIWMPVPWYGDLYMASNFGRIKSLARNIEKKHSRSGKVCTYFYKERILTPHYVNGYRIARFGHKKKKYSVQVGRLVLMAFVGQPKPGQECCHNNGTPDDNRLANLRWDTHLENNRDRVRHGTYKRGSEHHYSKYPEDIRMGVAAGSISKNEALHKLGISNTHFYRLKKLCQN